MQRPTSREVSAPSLSTPRLLLLAALVAAGSAVTVVGAAWCLLTSIFPLRGDDGLGTAFALAGLLPVVVLATLWAPWLAAALVPRLRPRRGLLAALAAGPTAGLGALIALAPSAGAVVDESVGVRGSGSAIVEAGAIFAAVAFGVLVVVLVQARAGRWASLQESAPLLGAAAVGVLIALVAQTGAQMVVLVAFIAPLVSAALFYLLSPLWVLGVLAHHTGAGVAPAVAAGVAGLVTLVLLAPVSLWGAPLAACAAVTVTFVAAEHVVGRNRTARA